MIRHNIPTAAYETLPRHFGAGSSIFRNARPTVRLKADGLAAGKGVLIEDLKKQKTNSKICLLIQSLEMLQLVWL